MFPPLGSLRKNNLLRQLLTLLLHTLKKQSSVHPATNHIKLFNKNLSNLFITQDCYFQLNVHWMMHYDPVKESISHNVEHVANYRQKAQSLCWMDIWSFRKRSVGSMSSSPELRQTGKLEDVVCQSSGISTRVALICWSRRVTKNSFRNDTSMAASVSGWKSRGSDEVPVIPHPHLNGLTKETKDMILLLMKHVQLHETSRYDLLLISKWARTLATHCAKLPALTANKLAIAINVTTTTCKTQWNYSGVRSWIIEDFCLLILIITYKFRTWDCIGMKLLIGKITATRKVSSTAWKSLGFHSRSSPWQTFLGSTVSQISNILQGSSVKPWSEMQLTSLL